MPPNQREAKIPNTIDRAFSGCSGLTLVTISDSVTAIGDSAFEDCSGLKGELKIPANVTSIGHYAFKGCSGFTEIIIPENVTSIGWGAFEGCSWLKEVHISDLAAWCGIEFGSYDANPLYYAHHLFMAEKEIINLKIPNSVTSIGSYAFDGCSGLFSVTIESGVTAIGDSAFEDCSGLTSVIIPKNVTSIGHRTFFGCNGLTSIDIPDSVIAIGWGAFEGCSGLTSVTIPKNVTSIGSYAFNGCSGLQRVIWNAENCTEEGNGNVDFTIFGGYTNLSSVTFGENVKTIPACAFSGCSGLTSITIPKNVTSIGRSAFSGCSKLKEVHFENPKGWKVSVNKNMSGAIGVSGLNNPATAAGLLMNTFSNRYWKRG